MGTTNALCFFHPTTVVIVDDNKLFLENLPENLNNTLSYQLFDLPKNALTFLETKRENLITPDSFLGITDDLATGEALNVNIPKIRTILQDKKRFEIPSVLIIDHDMPGISGLEFCRKLKSYPIKKIMLTGAADLILAIQAFNDGIIHKFITKDDPNVFEALDKAVQELQQDYFATLSEQIVKNITTRTFSLLAKKEFQDFLTRFISENNITEFYLTDAMGSFLLLNNKGETTWIAVQSDEEIENYRRIAEDHAAPADIIKAITSKEKLLCLFSEEDFNQPVQNWGNYLYPAYRISGTYNGHYAVVLEPRIAVK